MLGGDRTRGARHLGLIGLGLLLLSCSAILGIEDRELRSDADGGAGGAGAETGSGPGGSGATGPGGSGVGGGPVVDRIDCSTFADSCQRCACDSCVDVMSACEASGADCLSVALCVSSSGCRDAASCEADCGGSADQAGAPPGYAGELGSCVASCAECQTSVSECVSLAITGNPSATSCWSCACTECQDLQALADCRDIYDCNDLAACIAQTGCRDGADCESMCGPGVDPGLGDPGVQELSDCITNRCPGSACSSISTYVDPPYGDASMCTSRYDDGSGYPYCMDCACNSCSAMTVSTCAQGNVDCEAAVRCMTMAGCSDHPSCTAQNLCNDVFERNLPDAALVDDLGRCATTCGECQDFAASNDPRDRCAEQLGDLSCAPCMCNNCPEDLIRQCVDQVDCRQAWECMQSSGCNGTECVMQCQSVMVPPTLLDQLVQCALNDCMSCTLAKGPGGMGGSEICNLRDDDGDGVVDEGFTWTLGSMQTQLSRADDITDLQVRAIPGRDEVVVGFLEGPQSTPFFAVISTSGGVPAGPTSPAAVATSYAVAADSAFAGMLSVEAGCAGSCAAVQRIDLPTYGIGGSDVLDFQFSNAQIFDLGVYSAIWTTMSLSDTGALVWSWLDQQGTPFPGFDRTFQGPWGSRGALAQRDWWGVGVVERILPPSLEVFTVDLSVYTADGPYPTGLSLPAAAGLALGQPLALANPPPGMTESAVAVLYGGGGQSTIARLDPSVGSVEYGPVDTVGQFPLSVVNVGGNFVTLTRDAGDLWIDRFTDTLEQPYAEMTPTGYPNPDPGSLNRLVSVGSRLLLFTATGMDLLMTELGCDPP